MAIVRSTPVAAAGGYKTSTPLTSASITVSAGAVVVVVSAMGDDNALLTLTTTDSGSHTWTRSSAGIAGPGVGGGVGCAVDWWYNGTGSSASFTVTSTFATTSGNNSDCYRALQVLTGVADPAVSAPAVVAASNSSAAACAATITPPVVGSQIVHGFIYRSATAPTLLTGTGTDSSPASTNTITGEAYKAGFMFRSTTEASTSSVTVGDSAPSVVFASIAVAFQPSGGTTTAPVRPKPMLRNAVTRANNF